MLIHKQRVICDLLTRAAYNSSNLYFCTFNFCDLHLIAKGDETAHITLYSISTLILCYGRNLNFFFFIFFVHYDFGTFFSLPHMSSGFICFTLFRQQYDLQFIVLSRKQMFNCHVKTTFENEFVANGHFFFNEISKSFD